jgi:hypothetical protein
VVTSAYDVPGPVGGWRAAPVVFYYISPILCCVLLVSSLLPLDYELADLPPKLARPGCEIEVRDRFCPT